jgi:hypothetical protein
MTATNITLAPTRCEFDRVLIENLDGYGPRYTSYPTADRFHDGFTERDYRHWLQQRQIGASAWPLSLYVHLPFCNTVCYYCACNKVITKDRSKADGVAKRQMHIQRQRPGACAELPLLQPMSIIPLGKTVVETICRWIRRVARAIAVKIFNQYAIELTASRR